MVAPALPRQAVRFGDFEASLRPGELRRHGLKVKLADQSFQILVLLLENPGEVVTREELRQRLWREDTFVDFEAGLNSAIRRLREALCDSADTPRFIETLPRRGYRFIQPVKRDSPEDVVQIQSLAMLPLENLMGDPAQEYFVDGMTDALINRLAQIGALRVISRTSVMAYKGKNKPLPQIARELNVEAIVEGAVARSGNRVRITAQLIHAPSDRHLWATEYERDLTDILLLQAEVASAIANEVQIRLTPQERARLASARMVNPEAYDAYLRGRLHWNKRTEEGMKKGLELFQQALAKDPSYAMSHAGMAECHNMLGFWGVAAPHEVSPNAKTAASLALEIDANLAEGHAARGWAQFAYDWDWAGAEKELQRAIELNPGYATAHQWYSHLLAYQGRHAEASGEVERTLELDPLSLVMNSNGAFVCLLGRRYDEAMERARGTIELDSTYAPAHLWLGCTYEQKGRFEEALREFHESVKLAGSNTCYLSALAHCYAVADQTAQARAVLAQLGGRSKQRYVSAYDFAVIHAGLGDKEAAMICLERAYQEHSTWLAFLKGDSRLDAIRSAPFFRDLVHRLGLPVD